jgi:hypothetical protein
VSSRPYHQIVSVLLVVCFLISAVALTACNKKQTSCQFLVTIRSGEGDVSPNYGTFNEGSRVTLTAIPASGWTFDHWGDSVNGRQNPITIVVHSYEVIASTSYDFVDAYFRKLISPTATPTQTVNPSNVVTFADVNLDKVIRGAINKPTGDLHESDLNELTVLSTFGSDFEPGISDLTSIEHCTALWYLDLQYNNITNISALAGLTGLQDIFLNNNNISDISALSRLTNLWRLDLDKNFISDISVLSNLTEISLLYLDRNNITNISALSGLTDLNRLSLCYNNLSDISTLSHLTNLVELKFYNNNISDISVLAGLTNLSSLDIDNNDISNISALSGLTNLTYLHLADNNISDLKPLVDNSGLSADDVIYLENNPLSNTSLNVYIPELENRGVQVHH